jgi:dGTPase
MLRPEATQSAASRGRRRPEAPHPFRTAFQRDRDRILHSKAFRRLAHKTQVFLAPEGDHYRVRLTHTLEVVQIARTIARALQLNEDLVEAICLGHDVGHTPFGHLGEEVLTEFLGRPFRHSEQSLRILDALEMRGAERGLNLTWEVRDGILNHTWSMPRPSTLEAKVARYADRIAYINHDIDDALRAGVLTDGDLPADTRRVLGATSSERVDTMVGALVEASAEARDIRMEAEVFGVLMLTRGFLFERVYQRPEVAAEQEETTRLLRTVCEHYRLHPEDLPEGLPDDSSADSLGDPDEDLPEDLSGGPSAAPLGDLAPGEPQGEGGSADDPETRLVDYVAGMTDRFARREYQRITGEPT